MEDRFRVLKEAISEAVMRGPGRIPPEVRQAVARGEAPEELRPLVEKIRREPWKVTDEDLGALRARYSEDELFELMVATVCGAADERLQAAMKALEGA